MKKLIAGAIALTLLSGSAAFAQNDQYQNPYSQTQGRNQYQTPDNQAQGRNRSQTTNSQAQGRNQNQNRYNQTQDAYQYQTPYAQAQAGNDVRDNPHWSRGDRLPSEYRSNQYVVSDWRNRHLSTPPRGYHWVEANNRYVLASIANGIIAATRMNDNRTR